MALNAISFLVFNVCFIVILKIVHYGLVILVVRFSRR